MCGSDYDVVEYFILYIETRAYIVRRGSRCTTNERSKGNYLGNYGTIASFGSCASIISSQSFPIFILGSITRTAAQSKAHAWSTFAPHFTCYGEKRRARAGMDHMGPDGCETDTGPRLWSHVTRNNRDFLFQQRSATIVQRISTLCA